MTIGSRMESSDVDDGRDLELRTEIDLGDHRFGRCDVDMGRRAQKRHAQGDPGGPG